MKTTRLDIRPHQQKLIDALREWAATELAESGKVRPVIVGCDACDLRVAVHSPRTKTLGGEPPAP